MITHPWQGLAGPGSRIVDLGRPAVFYIPIVKLDVLVAPSKVTVREWLHEHLIREYGAYTSCHAPQVGFYCSGDGIHVGDESAQYEVSFVGKERIPDLTAMIAQLARVTEEECIYLRTGQYSCLVYPA